MDNAYRNDSFAYQKEQDALNNAYRDETFAYQKEQDALSQKNYEDSFAYQKEQDALNNAYRDETFAYQKEQDALAQQNYEESFAYQQEQDALDNAYRDETFAYQKEQDAQAQLNYENEFAYKQNQDALDNAYRDETFAYQKEQDALAQKNYEDAFAYQKEQDAQSQANWQAEFDREGEWYNGAQEASNPYTTYEGDGMLNGQEVPKQLAGVQGLTTTNTKYFDENGEFKKASVVRTNDDGTITYNYDGKEVTLKAGTNPYTNTTNPDTQYGTFSNGYQPNNLGLDTNGNVIKLSKYTDEKTGVPRTDVINGVTQSVWKSSDGKLWIWDGTQNKYLEYEQGDTTNGSTNGSTTPTTSTNGSTTPTSAPSGATTAHGEPITIRPNTPNASNGNPLITPVDNAPLNSVLGGGNNTPTVSPNTPLTPAGIAALKDPELYEWYIKTFGK